MHVIHVHNIPYVDLSIFQMYTYVYVMYTISVDMIMDDGGNWHNYLIPLSLTAVGLSL